MQPPLFHTPTTPTGRPDYSHHPQWLQDELTGRRPNPRHTWWNHCRHCGRLILTGDDANHMALTVNVDPHPLTTEQHMTAVLARSISYLAAPTQHPHRWALHRLEHWHRWNQLPGALLLPPHYCHHPRHGPSLAHEPDPQPRAPDAPLPF